jgi:hypothetical protein
MDCYHHAVHLLECFIPATSDLTFSNTASARYFSYSFSPTDIHAPAFRLDIEQQLSRTSTLDIGYQHLRGLHLVSSYNANINLDGARPDPTRGNIKPYSSIFDSYYDGLEVSYLQRPVSWGSVRVSYTLSHAIDDVGEFS